MVARREDELTLESDGRIRLPAKRRTAGRRAVEREVNPGLVEARPQFLVQDVVERAGAAARLPALPCSEPRDLPDAVGRSERASQPAGLSKLRVIG